jgi:hypothetical protein
VGFDVVMSKARQRQVDQNYKAFATMLSDFMRHIPGKFVLMRNTMPIEWFDTSGDAYRAGMLHFKDGLFSIQEVTDRPVRIR